MIATSTGGPRALASLVPTLPAPLGIGTLIVQHMPAGFTGSLATRLNASSALNVVEATGGEKLDARTALLAPGGRHLRLARDGRTTLTDEPAVGGLRPRADLLIEDAAHLYRERMLLVVLTGMGNDGLRGAREVRGSAGASSSSPRTAARCSACRARSSRAVSPTTCSTWTSLAQAIASEAGS